ncbi:ComEC/Rec2 family competence protein [Hyphomicrobium sp. LHD-15]|uniref:ComEC/Rec2 family competence protein n=1 Tax=Hyphomicrobium sp. LHD-15 TaxID=3072142 RepID=UPI0028109561|nr:ComEC/Rec2 family competence protein [Hyphomicrobium sp. LHD-15]MDQ8700365.1 ComEC/Rec2 family competence protein [Hyphomicrobium sp. LHD-15]
MDATPGNERRTGSVPALWRLAGRLSIGRALRENLERERARWFAWLPVALGIGIAVYFSCTAEPTLWVALALPVMAIGLAAASRKGGLLYGAALALLAGTIGFSVAKLRTEWTRAPVLPFEMHRASVEGIVELIEPRPGRGERITLRVTEFKGLAPEQRPERIRVRVMIKREGLKPGDTVRLRASLRPPSIPTLPGDYDFARTAWFQKLGATGYSIAPVEIVETAAAREQSVVPKAREHLLPKAREQVLQQARDGLERLRQWIGERIRAAVPGEAGAIAVSLITGERGGITEETNEAYRDSGLVHILSISGLHMVIMAGAVFASIRLLLAAFPGIALRFATKKWAAFGALIAAGAYLLISSPSTATLRAFLMTAIMFVAVMADRQALAMRNVAIAALFILLLMPESLLDAGFQMSFAAVVSLIAAYEAARARTEQQGREGWLRPIAFFFGGILLSTVIASLAVAPFGAYHFHRSQQYALLANLIAVPICNLIVMPAALLTLVMLPFGLEAIPLGLMAKGIEMMSATAYWVASLPGAVAHIPKISEASFALMIAGGLWLTLWQTRWRALGLIAIGGGVLIAGGGAKPDILVGRGGDLVAVRGSNGSLAANGPRAGSFELQRWLDSDGDARRPADVLRAPGFDCDGAGCTATTRDLRVAVSRHPSALIEDCVKADIVISGPPRPAGCTRPLLVLDRAALKRDGTHAIYLEEPTKGAAARIAKVETVANLRGERPWTAHSERARAKRVRTHPPPTSKSNGANPREDAQPATEPSGSVLPQAGNNPLPDDDDQ